MAAADFKAELVGVFGHPVAENPTIVMLEAAFKALDLHWRYLTIEVYPHDLEDAIRGLRAFNMRGVNLTIPHKLAVLAHLDEVAPDAALIGAVNTVHRQGDRLIGENTDGKGFLRSLRDDAGLDPNGKRVVVLGAGGAARAVAVELALAGAAQLIVVNRSPERGRELTELINGKTPAVASFVPWDHPYALPADSDVLVNATSIGLYPGSERPELDYDTIAAGMIACDVIPNPPDTPFLQEALRRGARTLDGLGMLVYQGAIAFKLWTGREAPLEVMHRALAQTFVPS